MNTEQEWIFCEKCGVQNPWNTHACESCGHLLHGRDGQSVHVADDNTLGGLVPYHNAPAMWSYYMGIFSIIPFLGIPLGLAALITGFVGLAKVREEPEVKGKVHAWVGIIAGGIMFLIHGAVVVTMALALFMG